MNAQTPTQRNRTWAQLQTRLQGRQYPDDPYVALAVAMFVSVIRDYQIFGSPEHESAVAFLHDYTSPWHQILELDEESVTGLLQRVNREQPTLRGGSRKGRKTVAP